MLISHVIDSLEVGGAEAVVAALGRLQAARGHSVEVHCLLHAGALADQLSAEGIAVHVQPAGGTLRRVSNLYRAFKMSRPAVVHCHNKSATVHAAAAARLAGVKAIISTRHGMARPPYRLRKELKFWVTSALFCSRVVAVCETARVNMRSGAGIAARNVVTIRNGAFPSAMNGSGEPERGRGFTLIAVGRLAPAKSYDTLLRGVALAKRTVPDLTLLLVGDGDEASSLKQLSADLGLDGIVQFCGERDDVGAWLRRADVFVMSSISEGLPISILEAMAAGLPSIVTDVGGMPEVVQLSGAGKIVPPRSPETLAAAIVEFAEQRTTLGEIGRRASECYQRHFTPQRMAEDYMNLYRTCLSPAGGD